MQAFSEAQRLRGVLSTAKPSPDRVKGWVLKPGSSDRTKGSATLCGLYWPLNLQERTSCSGSA